MSARWSGFHSPVASHIEQFLASTRALGCKFATEERMLRLLDRFLVEQHIDSLQDLTGACLERFLASRQRVNARSFNHLLGVVRRLLNWMVSQQVLTRRVLTHRVAITLEALHATEVIEQALAKYGTPEIVNTDHGSQFTAEEFTRVVLDAGCKLSMDGRGAWRDNVFVERLWRSVKYERVYLKAYDSVSAARDDIADCLA